MSNYGGYRSGTGHNGGSYQQRSYNKYSGSRSGAGYSNSYNSSLNGYNNYRAGGYGDYDKSYNNKQHQGDHGSQKPYLKNKFTAGTGRTHSSSSPPYQDSFQIWMGDLDPNWNEQAIMELWKAMGELPTAVKILKTDPYKPAYCFVSFASHQHVSSAIQKNGMQIPGSSKVFKLNWASGGPAAGSGGNNSGASSNSYQRGGGNGGGGPTYNDQLSVFVGDLGADMTESVLYEVFSSKFPGEVKQVKIMVDMATRTSKGFGFIRFGSAQAHLRAIKEMNGFSLKGRPIKVGPASRDAPGTTPTSLITGPAERGGPVTSVGGNGDSSIPLAQAQPALNQFTDPNNTGIYIKGIPPKFNENELRKLFAAFGYIIRCEISGDVGHIKFLDRSAAEAAMLALGDTEIGVSRILINWDKTDLSGPAPLKYGNLGTQVHTESEVEESEPLLINRANGDYISKRFERYDLLYGS